MSRPVRRVLVCVFLLLAIPMKGAWAGGMAACDPVRAPGATYDESRPHEHATSHDHDVGDGAPAHRHDAGGHPQNTTEHAGCGNCTACCVGGSLIDSVVPSMPSSPDTRPEYPPVTGCFFGHVPATPERPPRTFLA